MANNQNLILSNFFNQVLPDINISQICVFGQNGNEFILITNEDNVFAFGDNLYGCLGLGHNNPVKEPTLVTELVNKNVIHICYGNQFAICLTKSGQCFSWGRNYNGMLGNGTQTNTNEPTLINALNNELIIAISCGYSHSLVLTQKGIIYGFGYNKDGNIGIGNNIVNQLTPIKVNGLDSIKIVSIACGGYHSLALTEDGTVYGWGLNNSGQLGIGNNINQNIPIKVNLSEQVIIKQISCGLHHSLLLSREGDIYAIGLNHVGQLGNGDKINQNIAIKLNYEMKFTEIGSHSLSNISIALSQNGFCYVWGDCDNEVITTPKETRIQLIAVCFVVYSKIKRTLNLMRFHSKTGTNKVSESIVKSFNNPETSDFTFKFADNVIHVDKSYVKKRNPHFWALFSETEKVLNAYEVNFAFIKYLYTDSVEVEVENAIELYGLAESCSEEELKLVCTQTVKNGIAINNAFTLYSSAVKYQIKELEDFCARFAAKNLKQVIMTDAFEELDPLLCKRFMKSAAVLGFID